MTTTLPKRLCNEPLLDAVFECRFTAHHPVSNILPGILFSEFDGEKKIERLPQSELPEVIRKNDPNLQYAPLIRIRLQNYSVLIGDHSLAIACNLPYKGWNEFKSVIIKTIGILKKSNLVDKIIRYSIKYVDLIQSKNSAEQVSLANLSLRIGSHKLMKESYQVRMEIPINNEVINIIQIISGAKVTMSNKSTLEGVLIDIDTIKNIDGIPINQLEEQLNDALEHIHDVNKETFFDCLTEQTLKQLEPEYE
ncbi:MAG: TIGR04255 family protein [Candidatus Electrothrix sp. GM3_4]|nr:TIGR04255 family protein [Candidatus Electrothrix sp. GM3_4]